MPHVAARANFSLHHYRNHGSHRFTHCIVHMRLARACILSLLLGVVWFGLTTMSVWAATPQFTDSGQLLGEDPSTDVALGDFNGDGHLDAWVTNSSPDPSQIWFNNGKGVFRNSGQSYDSTTSIGVSKIAVGDLDGDGDLDALMSIKSDQSLVWLSNGTGTFVKGQEVVKGGGLALGDLDGDGDLDAIIGNQIWLNNGSATLSASAQTLGTFAADSVVLGDLDEDGDLDVWGGGIWLNNGSGSFSAGPSPEVSGEQVALGDLDGDGDSDAFLTNFGNHYVAINDGTADFSDTGQRLGTNEYPMDVALGDLDGDGDLDAFVGNWSRVPSSVWINDGSGEFSSNGQSLGNPHTTGAALGDLDGDGDLDAFSANFGSSNGEANIVWLNNGGGLLAVGETIAATHSYGSAMGDVNGDRKIDLVAGGRVRLNQGAGTLVDGDTVPNTGAVTLADLDGDHDLDGVFAFEIWTNNGSGAFSDSSRAIGNPAASNRAVELGDVNGDGALDAVLAGASTNSIWLNDGSGNYSDSGQQLGDLETFDVALGDLDRDGDLDAVFAHHDVGNTVWFNNGLGGFSNSGQALGNRTTDLVALGDLDGDGDLDAFFGNEVAGQEEKVWLNDGTGHFTDSGQALAPNTSYTTNLALGDLDGDGDLDAVATNSNGPANFWINDGSARFRDVGQNLTSPPTHYVTLGDLDGDGDLDVVIGQGSSAAYLLLKGKTGGSTRFQIAANRPGPTQNAAFYSTPTLLTEQNIVVDYALYDQASLPMGYVAAFYSQDGGDHWLPALAAQGTITRQLTTAPLTATPDVATLHTFTWDTFASGFFGQSDNVVLRLVAYPQFPPTEIASSYEYVNQVAGPYQWPFAATTTYPFRVRGTQVRVLNAQGQPTANALVYRIPVGQSGGLPMSSNSIPFHTSVQGYLSGRGTLQVGDQILALLPVQNGPNYTLYQTSARPTASGLEAHTVSQAGVQNLTVSAANPLLLFDLKVALEWDASKDQTFLAQLNQNLKLASAALYDWSNGQVALRQVTVYQNREQWETADLRVYASNQHRPVANQGGVVSDTLVISDPRLSQPITATRGEIRIGSVWSRYGDPSNIGSDWPNVLAHELAHYLLFLEDSYLGLDAETGLLVPVDSCTGTAMSDPYLAEASEFRIDDGTWQQQCGGSLAELPDWEMIRLVYPALHAPTSGQQWTGELPFSFTQVKIVTPAPANPPLLDDAYVDLGTASAQLTDGRAYLVKPTQIVDLGRPVAGAVQAYGAQEGEELCVFGRAHFACSRLSNGQSAQFSVQPLWNPELSVTPVNTTTVRLRVQGTSATVTLYPNGTHPQTVNLAAGVEQQVTLSQPSVEVWLLVKGPAANQRLMTSYNIGAGPGRIKSHAGPGRIKSHAGPLTTGDGAVTIYPPKALPNSVFMVVQTAPVLPALPPGLTPIGRGYRIQPTGQVASYAEASLTFQYLGLDVVLAGVPESGLAIYYGNGTSWQRLPTVLNRTQNFASAPLPGAGFYVLLSSHVVPLATAGWNVVGYSVEETRLITEALASIEGYYTTVYGYEATDSTDRWKVYGTTAPAWVNDLHQFEYGKGYWIYASQTITLYLEGVPLGEETAQVADVSANLSSPPATFYGRVLATANFAPQAGLRVLALVAGKQCGQGQTLTIGGQIVYKVDVSGATEVAGCGQAGQPVNFQVGPQAMVTTDTWSNQGVQALDLQPTIPNDPDPEPTPTPTPNPEPQAPELFLPLVP